MVDETAVGLPVSLWMASMLLCSESRRKGPRLATALVVEQHQRGDVRQLDPFAETSVVVFEAADPDQQWRPLPFPAVIAYPNGG